MQSLAFTHSSSSVHHPFINPSSATIMHSWSHWFIHSFLYNSTMYPSTQTCAHSAIHSLVIHSSTDRQHQSVYCFYLVHHPSIHIHPSKSPLKSIQDRPLNTSVFQQSTDIKSHISQIKSHSECPLICPSIHPPISLFLICSSSIHQ